MGKSFSERCWGGGVGGVEGKVKALRGQLSITIYAAHFEEQRNSLAATFSIRYHQMYALYLHDTDYETLY